MRRLDASHTLHEWGWGLSSCARAAPSTWVSAFMMSAANVPAWYGLPSGVGTNNRRETGATRSPETLVS